MVDVASFRVRGVLLYVVSSCDLLCQEGGGAGGQAGFQNVFFRPKLEESEQTGVGNERVFADTLPRVRCLLCPRWSHAASREALLFARSSQPMSVKCTRRVRGNVTVREYIKVVVHVRPGDRYFGVCLRWLPHSTA